MHLNFLTRGAYHNVALWKTLMQSQIFSWKRELLNKKGERTGKYREIVIQGALRPIQLWEYVFPEESLPQVLAMLRLTGKRTGNNTPSMNMGIAMLRKALKSEKVPSNKEVPDVERDRLVATEGVAIHPIGIKRDIRNSHPSFIQSDAPYGTYQENL